MYELCEIGLEGVYESLQTDFYVKENQKHVMFTYTPESLSSVQRFQRYFQLLTSNF